MPSSQSPRLPFALKLSFTAFIAVLVPVYWSQYGPTNFLFFCDLALALTLIAVWTEQALPAGMAAVGILIPQFFWCLDFVTGFVGWHPIGMTRYMFDSSRSVFLRSLSLFHGWLPFLLLYLVKRLGYDRRALFVWTGLAWMAMLASYFFLPRPGALLANPLAPVNVNFVFGLSDSAAQTWMPEVCWLVLLLIGLPVLIYLPTHWALNRWANRCSNHREQVA
jgi:hypothetical protein